MRIYPGTTVDYEFATLGGLGYTGTLNDRQFAALRAEGLTGSLPDMFGQFDGTLDGGVVDPDAAILAILSDGGHMAIDSPKPEYLWVESTKVTQVDTTGDLIGAALTRFGTTAYNFLQSTVGALPSWDDFGWMTFTGASAQLLQSTDGVGILNAAPGAFLSANINVTTLAANSGIITVGTPTANVTRVGLQVNLDGSLSFFAKRLDVTAITTLTTAAGLISVGIPYVVSAQVDYASTLAMKIWINGTEVASGTVAGVTGLTEATDSNRFLIGRNASSSVGVGYFTGRIRRPMVVRKILSDAERAVAEAWVGGAVETINGFDLGFGGRSFFSGNPSMALVEGDTVYLTIAKDNGLGSQIIEWDKSTSALRIAFQSATTSGNDHADGCLIKTAAATYLYSNSPHTGAEFYIGRGATVSGLVETDIAASLGTSNLSYANTFQLNNGTIYQFGRGGGSTPRPPRYSKSTDDGVTWSGYTAWLWNSAIGHAPYIQFEHGGDRVWFMSTDTHPDLAPTGPYKNNIYMGYFKDDDKVYDLGNVDLGAFPVLPTAPTEVFDGSTDGAWCWDLKKHVDDLTGVFASFPTTSAHRYHRVRVVSGTTQVELVVNDAGGPLYAGQPYYSGGICCHPTDPDILYASYPVSAVHQVHRMDRVSEGVWTPTQLTFGTVPSFRPDTSTGILTFVRGTYTDYGIFPECHIMGMKI